MFERFTDQARRIVVLAQDEAITLHHDCIGPEHLLLALIREDTGRAATALKALGITEDAARQQVVEIAGHGQQDPPRGHVPMTPRAKKALELSMREAIALGSNCISTEHILLGLIREGQDVGSSPAIEALNGLIGDPNRVRQEVIKLIVARRGESEAEDRPPADGKRAKRKFRAEVRDRLSSIEWRLAVLEHRVGTGPDVLDKAAREQEPAVLPSLTDEVQRLRELLRRHGIDPQDGAA